MKGSCTTCKFFEGAPGKGQGICKRYPPVPVDRKDAASVYPTVLLFDNCGEFEGSTK